MQHWYESDGNRKVGLGRLWPSAFYSFSVPFSQTPFRVLDVAAWWHMDSEELACLLGLVARIPFLYSCNIDGKP
jgi:hypothetical protein